MSLLFTESYKPKTTFWRAVSLQWHGDMNYANLFSNFLESLLQICNILYPDDSILMEDPNEVQASRYKYIVHLGHFLPNRSEQMWTVGYIAYLRPINEEIHWSNAIFCMFN